MKFKKCKKWTKHELLLPSQTKTRQFGLDIILYYQKQYLKLLFKGYHLYQHLQQIGLAFILY